MCVCVCVRVRRQSGELRQENEISRYIEKESGLQKDRTHPSKKQDKIKSLRTRRARSERSKEKANMRGRAMGYVQCRVKESLFLYRGGTMTPLITLVGRFSCGTGTTAFFRLPSLTAPRPRFSDTTKIAFFCSQQDRYAVFPVCKWSLLTMAESD